MWNVRAWVRGAVLVCTTSVVWLSPGPFAHAQERPGQRVVEEVVDTICQKRVVLLGELPSHGEGHAFDAKARIVDRLVAQCGFTAILFEAPVYDFIGLERAVRTRTAAQEQLDNAIGRFWWTRELAPWRRGLFEAVAGQRLVVGGLDDQVSITSHYARATLPRLIASLSLEGTAKECELAADRHLRWTYDAAIPFDDREKRRLQECARQAADATAARAPSDPADHAMLESLARYATRQREGTAVGRDESMFRNLVWYLDRLPANARVVVWTATVHAARQRGPLAEVPLGARALERWGAGVGAIGFTAYAGQTSRAGRPASAISEAPADSLEAAATRAAAWAWLDSEGLRALGRVPSRLLGRFQTETWVDYFDAVVVIRQEVAPRFDAWK